MRRTAGFTLLEVMIAVAIVAILAAIALPSYTEYIKRARVVDATQALSSMRVKMEQHFQDHRTWANACGSTVISKAPGVVGQWNIGCTNLGADTYTVQASGIAGTSMAGAVYEINQSNQRSTVTPVPGWSASTCGWGLKKDGSC